MCKPSSPGTTIGAALTGDSTADRQTKIAAETERANAEAAARMNAALETTRQAQARADAALAAAQARSVQAPSTADADAAAEAERARNVKARGRASTVLTSGQGVTGDSGMLAAPAARALLG